jgi:excisionase family DNA binding protein
MAERRFLTVAEAAEELGITDQTVRVWLKSGRLKGTRPGGTKAGWRIQRASVEALLDPELTQAVLPIEETSRSSTRRAAPKAFAAVAA